MKKLILPLCLIMAWLATGCGSLNRAMPHTTIDGSIGGKPFSFSSPKDSDLAGLELTAETNGTIHIHIDHLAAHTDPTVVSNAGSAQVQIIAAQASAVEKLANSLGNLAGTAAAAAAK